MLLVLLLRRLLGVRNAIDNIASGEGDLTQRLPEEGNDEVTQIARAFNRFVGKMEEVLTESREEMSPYAPRIYTTKIPVDKIRDVIGPGGKVIKDIIARTQTKIDINDDGTIKIASNDQKAIKKAYDMMLQAESGLLADTRNGGCGFWNGLGQMAICLN